jgi:hypothetical protein
LIAEDKEELERPARAGKKEVFEQPPDAREGVNLKSS